MRLLAAALLSLTLAMPALAANEAAKIPAQAQAETAKAGMVDINRASLDELKALRGIGDVRAAAIVKGRPYARKDGLARKGVMPQAVYDEIREQIVARRAP